MATSSPKSYRVVYKTIGTQEIDVDIYLPPSSAAANPILIDIHGGAFMLGSSKMINWDQVQDCLDRKWIVLAPNHRLCPQVNLLEGPIQDCRDLLSWIHDGGLAANLQRLAAGTYIPDLEHVFAFGTSSGGTLALSLGYNVRHPLAGIFDMYGPCDFARPHWTAAIAAMKLPPHLTPSFLNKIYDEVPIPITGGVSLEGQATGPPDFSDPRQAFALAQVANGTVMSAVYPSEQWSDVDPLLNIEPGFPPTYIVHGEADTKVPVELSRKLYAELQKQGIRCGMSEAPGEEHTFAAKMKVDSRTWLIQRRGFDFLEGLLV